ncbi:MAG: hypothetical protein Q9165_001818 [Trypethelium subeluteriae]
MSRPDAERALGIYRTFVKQTDNVVQYLGLARNYEHMTRLEIPKIKHAPTSLAASLEEYLNDKDFEVNRRQYLAQQEAKRTGKKPNGATKAFGESKSPTSKTDDKVFPTIKSSQVQGKEEARGPAPDLIDLFESIEQNQQPLGQSTAYGQPTQYSQVQTATFAQQTGTFSNASTNPFGQPQQQPQPQQLQSNYPEAGFGGYTAQPQPAFDVQQTGMQPNGFSSFPQQQQQPGVFGQQQQQPFVSQQDPMSPQSTNPFRQSTLPNITTGSPSTFGSSPVASPVNRQSTNPFAKSTSAPVSASSFTLQSPQSTFSSPPTQTTQPFSPPPPQPQSQPLQSAPTGTNPFARNAMPTAQPQQQQQPQQPQQPQSAPLPQSGLNMNVTGSTNPFRQSAFVNQQTGQGWQSGPQPTMGGFGNIETTPVFPRPGQGQQQQQTGQGGWG